MNVLILDGATSESGPIDAIRRTIETILKTEECTYASFELRKMKIRPCLGCFGCWLKTPGKCAIKDQSLDILRAAARSDLFIFLTPITFGGYSSELKKSLDRLLPLLLPFFVKIDGEVHHALRYAKRANIFTVGVSKERNEAQLEVFEKLLRRNAINIQSALCVSEAFLESDTIIDVERAIKKDLVALGVGCS